MSLNVFKESNLHGFSLMFKSEKHFIERLLWVITIGTSFYFVAKTCIIEWERYQKNDLVFSLETNYKNWEYFVPGVTICTQYIDPERIDNFIEESLRIPKNDSRFGLFQRFIKTVTQTTFNNLQHYSQFANYSFLDELDMLVVAKEMREYLLPPSGFNAVITEMGICFSTTYLPLIQNVSDRIVSTESDKGDICRPTVSVATCSFTLKKLILFNGSYSFAEEVWIHNKDDVMDPLPLDSISASYVANSVISVNLIINAIVSGETVKRLLPDQRKCYFDFETTIKYFKMYTVNLCMMSCRIDVAVKLCGCIPFFYKIADQPTCNIRGLVCLSNSLWFEKVSDLIWYTKECNCLPLCNSRDFEIIKQSTELLNDKNFTYSSSIQVSVELPKSRLKRGTLYSANKLLVSIGGAFGLYLGGSLMSVVEFLYFFLEILIKLFRNYLLSFKLG